MPAGPDRVPRQLGQIPHRPPRFDPPPWEDPADRLAVRDLSTYLEIVSCEDSSNVSAPLPHVLGPL